MTFEDWVAALRALKSEDFDCSDSSSDGLERLSRLTDAVASMPHPQQCVRELFSIMERLSDADLGSPGPIVHTLEGMDYEVELFASVRRHPTELSIWMLNRILNVSHSTDRREFLLSLLASAEKHERASDSTRAAAHDFIEYQARLDA